jgi:hypothetical protein
MNKCSILLINDQVVHGVKEKSCNVEFYKKNFHATHIQQAFYNNEDCFLENNGNCGLFIHTDCWKFIKKNYNIELKISDLPKIIKIKDVNKNFNINYGAIEKY